MSIAKYQQPKLAIKKIIVDTELSDEQKNAWYQALEFLTPEAALNILVALEQDGNTQDFLLRNFQEKIDAIKTRNKFVLDRLIEEERKMLEAL